MADDDSYDYLFKIILVGDMGVGKTCILQCFKSNTFIDRQKPTIGIDFTMKTLEIAGKKVKVRLNKLATRLRPRFHNFSFKFGTRPEKNDFER